MGRKSKREIERKVEQFGDSDEFSLEEFLWADLKAAHDGSLTRKEQLLVENPEEYLSPEAQRRINLGGGVA